MRAVPSLPTLTDVTAAPIAAILVSQSRLTDANLGALDAGSEQSPEGIYQFKRWYIRLGPPSAPTVVPMPAVGLHPMPALGVTAGTVDFTFGLTWSRGTADTPAALHGCVVAPRATREDRRDIRVRVRVSVAAGGVPEGVSQVQDRLLRRRNAR